MRAGPWPVALDASPARRISVGHLDEPSGTNGERREGSRRGNYAQQPAETRGGYATAFHVCRPENLMHLLQAFPQPRNTALLVADHAPS